MAVGKAMLEVRSIERQIRKLHESARKGVLAALTPEQRTKFKAIEDAALLPEATREAIRMGLTALPPMPPQGHQPMRMGQANPGPNQGPNQPGRMMQGP